MANKKPKKKKAKKKTAKKKTTKKAKKKTAKKKKPKPRTKLESYAPLYNLHQKKLAILRAVPIMPCSAIGRDEQGLRYAYTEATKVFNTYREESESRGLVFRLIEGRTTDAHRPERIKVGQKWEIKAVPCVRFEGVWEICDSTTGQKETFGGSGDGDNDIWSNTSAQTVAFKEALLLYYLTAWPQPSNHCEIIRKSLEEAGPEEFVKAMKMMIPVKLGKAMGIFEYMDDYFSKTLKKGKS